MWATMERGGATALLIGEVAGVEPGWRSGGRGLTVKSRGGRGKDGEAIFGGGRA
jgi:hypothetical protein